MTNNTSYQTRHMTNNTDLSTPIGSLMYTTIGTDFGYSSKAKYNNGVLEVMLKLKEIIKPDRKKINIE